jgi:hypothetical protein
MIKCRSCGAAHWHLQEELILRFSPSSVPPMENCAVSEPAQSWGGAVVPDMHKWGPCSKIRRRRCGHSKGCLASHTCCCHSPNVTHVMPYQQGAGNAHPVTIGVTSRPPSSAIQSFGKSQSSRLFIPCNKWPERSSPRELRQSK